MAEALMRRMALHALVLIVMSASAMAAQATVTLRGTVTDAASARPVAGAIVRIAAGQADRTTRSDERGTFIFSGLGVGALTLTVRTLGFEPYHATVDITPDIAPLAIVLRRIATLDTVTVRAAKQGLFGVVATAADLRPLPNAKLRVVGLGGGPVTLDSTAHFFVPVKTIGNYVLRATAPGYLDQTISVIVAPNDGVEVSFLLDSAVNGVSHKLDMPFLDFDERIKRRGLAGALVPRTEIMRDPKAMLIHAVRSSPSMASRNLRWDSEACVFVDGYAKPGLSINAIAPEDVEAVEVYNGVTGAKRAADRSGTLARVWPRSAPCGDTGMPGVASRGNRDDIIKWVVVWLKH